MSSVLVAASPMAEASACSANGIIASVLAVKLLHICLSSSEAPANPFLPLPVISGSRLARLLSFMATESGVRCIVSAARIISGWRR